MKMTKRLVAILLFLSILAATLLLPASAVEENNMFMNGDFEFAQSSWNNWTNDSAGASVSVSRDGGVDGSRCIVMENTKPVANSLFQPVNCVQGRKYMVTCDVRYENIGTEGYGFCIGNAAYDSAGNNIGETLSTPVFGSSEDWRTISFMFEVTNNPANMNVGPRLWFSTGKVYVDNVKLVDITDSNAESGTYELSLSETPNRHKVDALGAEWDPKIFLPVNLEKGITEEDLDFIKGRIDALGLQAVRMMITPDWFEKTNDNNDPAVADPAGFDFDNPEMKSVFAQLKVCEELGVRVTLTWWGAPAGHWLACENINDWIGAPNNLDEMAENISYLLGYIRDDLGYTCVKELILQNEPSYSFKVDGGAVDFDYYVNYYKTVAARLKADGMEDIVLVGADDSQDAGWFLRAAEALPEICGKFNSHNYAWSYDMPYLDVLIQEFVSARTSAAGDIPFFLGEFGDGTTTGAYAAASTDTHGRGIYIASVLVNAFKAGASGASYWPLHDIYYYENTQGGDNGGLMSMGLIGFKQDGAWSFRPSYYAYGLLCNAIPFGSEIYNITGDTAHTVDTVAVKTPEGRWSIIAVNRSKAEQSLHIAAPVIDSMMKSYTYAEGVLPTDGSMIAAADKAVAPVDGMYSLTVPAEGIVVLSNMDMTDEEMQIPEAPVETAPGESETAEEMGGETAEETAGESIDETVGETKEETTGESTEETTEETAEETAGESADETAGESAEETGDETAEESTSETHEDTNHTASTSDVGGADRPDKSGCASTLAGAAVVATLGAAVILAKRKSNEE